MVIQLFNNKWICRYPRPQKFVFDNGYDFKQYFTPLLKDFDIKHVLTSVKNPQDNAPVEQLHQVILDMLVTKDIDNKLFDYVCPCDESLASISCVIRASYHCILGSTTGQDFF